MKIHFLLISEILVVIWWAIGSIHTAALTVSMVLFNRNLSGWTKARYVLLGGPAVWIVILFCGLMSVVMAAIYRWKHRNAPKG